MAQIAREAGVTKAAVSYVLNGKADQVSEATRDRILEIARRLDYHPNALMRAVRTKRTQLIGVQWNMLNASIAFFGEILMGMQDTAGERGYDVLMAHKRQAREDSEKQIRRFRELRVDGLLVCPNPESASFYESIRKAGLPLVFVNNRIAGSAIPHVQSDDVLGAKLAVRHLIGLGHRRIATLSCEASGNFPMQERARGYQEALAEAGMPQDPALIVNCGRGKPPETRAAVRTLLAQTPFSALFMTTDHAAIVAMEELRAAGKRVPEDVAVVGYANLTESAHVTPSLTTVDQKAMEIGRLAMNVLIDRIEGVDKKRQSRWVTTPELIVRASSGINRKKV